MKLKINTQLARALPFLAAALACSGGEGVVDSVATIDDAKHINDAVSCATQVVALEISTESEGIIERAGNTSCPGGQGEVWMDSLELTTETSTLITTRVSFEACKATGVVLSGSIVVEQEAESGGTQVTRSHAALSTSLGDCNVDLARQSSPTGIRTAEGTLCGFDIDNF